MQIDKYNNYLTLALGGEVQSELKIEQFKNNYLQYFPSSKKNAILDVGPGKGEMLSCLKKEGYSNIEAVDISESVVHFVKGLGYKASLVKDLTSFLNNKVECFSLITMCDVVEHIPKDQILEILAL